MKQKLNEGDSVKPLHLKSIRSTPVEVPDPVHLVHLQFRRFAGCPVCDLHLHSFVRRYDELASACIAEVVVFHSNAEDLLSFYEEFPFKVVADPQKKLYAEFGVASAFRALASPQVWIPIVRGVARSLQRTIAGRAPLPTLMPHGGRFGLPADFLIAPSGVVLACKYGSHAYDQWSVDEVLALAQQFAERPARSRAS